MYFVLAIVSMIYAFVALFSGAPGHEVIAFAAAGIGFANTVKLRQMEDAAK